MFSFLRADPLCLALQLQAARLQRPAFQIRRDPLTSSSLTLFHGFFFSFFYIYISQPVMSMLRLIPLCLTAPPFAQNTDRRCETKGGRVEEELNRRSEVAGGGRKERDLACLSCGTRSSISALAAVLIFWQVGSETLAKLSRKIFNQASKLMSLDRLLLISPIVSVKPNGNFGFRGGCETTRGGWVGGELTASRC